LYDLTPSHAAGEVYSQLLLVPGLLGVTLAAIGVIFPRFVRSSAFSVGLVIFTLGLFAWRRAFTWLGNQRFLRERVYVLGAGERAQQLVRALPKSGLGIEVVGWTGDVTATPTKEEMAAHLQEISQRENIHRVIVAFPDRRGKLPVD